MRACPLDIRDPALVLQTIDRIWRDGPPNVLVNNAAGNFIARTEDLSARAIQAILNPTLMGACYMTVECGKRWLAEGAQARVLSIVAMTGATRHAFGVPSAACKAGLMTLTRSVAVEWGDRGIRLNECHLVHSH